MKRLFIIICLILFGCGPNAQNKPFPGAIYNFGKVNDNVYRGTQPYGTDYAGLSKLGIHTVLNLRGDFIKEEAELVEKAGLVYLHISMSSTRTPRIAEIKTALWYLQDPALWPIYIHCEGGLHRTGIVIAVYRVISGWDKTRAWKEAKDYGYYRGLGHGSIEDWFLNTFDPKDFK